MAGYYISKGDAFWTFSCGLAGVIAASAGNDLYHPIQAMFVGAIVPCIAYKLHYWVERTFKIDDAVGAVAVHGYCGFLGVVVAGFLLWGAPSSPYEGYAAISPWGNTIGALIMFFVLGFIPALDLVADPQRARPCCACRARWRSSASISSARRPTTAAVAEVKAASGGSRGLDHPARHRRVQSMSNHWTYSIWAVDLKDIGAIYPFQGFEVPMVIAGLAFWILWHVGRSASRAASWTRPASRLDPAKRRRRRSTGTDRY